MRRLLLSLLLALPLSADEVLTNAAVVKLVKAGLSAETIEAKIAASGGRFDVTTDAMVALAKEGVPDRVIRAMVTAPSLVTAAPSVARPAPRRSTTRRYDVAVHRDAYAKCDGAELRVDGRRVRATRCRDLDFDLPWNAITRVSYDYGFRGTIVFATEKGHHRISTTTPVEAKQIVEQIRGNAPVLTIQEEVAGRQ